MNILPDISSWIKTILMCSLHVTTFTPCFYTTKRNAVIHALTVWIKSMVFYYTQLGIIFHTFIWEHYSQCSRMNWKNMLVFTQWKRNISFFIVKLSVKIQYSRNNVLNECNVAKRICVEMGLNANKQKLKRLHFMLVFTWSTKRFPLYLYAAFIIRHFMWNWMLLLTNEWAIESKKNCQTLLDLSLFECNAYRKYPRKSRKHEQKTIRCKLYGEPHVVRKEAKPLKSLC